MTEGKLWTVGLLFSPDTGFVEADGVDVVGGAAGDVEARSGRIEGDAVIGDRDLHHLFLNWSGGGDVVDKDVFVRVRQVVRRERAASGYDVAVEEPVVA